MLGEAVIYEGLVLIRPADEGPVIRRVGKDVEGLAVSRKIWATQEPVALRECGCEPGKALSVKRNEMKAPALSVQMSSVKWSICRRLGCRAANHFGFSGVIVLVNRGIGLLD